MAYEESLRSISLDADSSLAVFTGVPGQPGSAVPTTGKQYTFVKVTGAHQVGLAVLKTDPVIGVVQNKPQVTGQAATVAIRGVTNMVAAAAITAGDKVSCEAVTGRAILTVTTDPVLGIALTSCTGAGQLVSVLLQVN